VSKYHAKREGKYASKRESRRAKELAIMESIGLISGLEEQVKYELVPKQEGERSVTYIADFRYVQNGVEITEDCKGMRTPYYILKRKLMLWVHGIRVLET